MPTYDELMELARICVQAKHSAASDAVRHRQQTTDERISVAVWPSSSHGIPREVEPHR
jgi:hypothetical protein